MGTASAAPAATNNASSATMKQYNHTGLARYNSYADCQKNLSGAVANVYRIGGHLVSQPSCKGRPHTTGFGFNQKTVYWTTYIGFDYMAPRAANPGDKYSGIWAFWG